MKNIFLFFLINLLIGRILIAGLSGCANIVPPQGGPRDSIPPQLIRVTPGDSTRNFSGSRIVFTFDEFIDVQNIQEQLLVSPSPNISPTVDFKLNSLTVKLKESLEPNTTYSLQFGNAIKDFTEGNPMKGFTYTFSTGPYIDSLELKGNLILAETGKIDSTLIIMLHTNPNDSAVIKEKPRYVARLDSKGNFIFKNLPPRTFYLYALKDDFGSRLYNDDKKLFAFADKPVLVDGKTEPVTLYAYSARPALQQALIPTSTLPLNRKKNTDVTVDTRLKYQTNLITKQQDLLSNFIMTFEQPLKTFDSTKMRLYTDTSYNPVTGYSIKIDSSNKKITLTNTWKESTHYHLILDKDFAIDSLGRKLLKTDTLSFVSKSRADYGSLKLKFRGLDLSKNPVLLFVLENTIVRSAILTNTEFSVPTFLPGEYELRILYDNNKNGVWDPGEFFGKHRQPEIVKPVERRIQVKPNSDNDIEIQL